MFKLTHAYQFPKTRWTIVARSGDTDETTRQTALGELCELYWPPVYAFVRSKGNSPQDAEDIVQGFFARLLERNDFSRADPSKGKMRWFLLASVKNHMANEVRNATCQKRGGETAPLSIDLHDAEERCLVPEPADHLAPDKIFQRQWVITLLDHVLQKLEKRYSDDGKAELFNALKPTLTPGTRIPPHAETANRLGMNEDALRVAVHRLRQRYARELRNTIADTLGPGEDPEEEIRAMMTAFD
jgi:RNA polymerase sigma-70 factor (ECF subfamily)